MFLYPSFYIIFMVLVKVARKCGILGNYRHNDGGQSLGLPSLSSLIECGHASRSWVARNKM